MATNTRHSNIAKRTRATYNINNYNLLNNINHHKKVKSTNNNKKQSNINKHNSNNTDNNNHTISVNNNHNHNNNLHKLMECSLCHHLFISSNRLESHYNRKGGCIGNIINCVCVGLLIIIILLILLTNISLMLY
jgi:hypothetical protein